MTVDVANAALILLGCQLPPVLRNHGHEHTRLSQTLYPSLNTSQTVSCPDTGHGTISHFPGVWQRQRQRRHERPIGTTQTQTGRVDSLAVAFLLKRRRAARHAQCVNDTVNFNVPTHARQTTNASPRLGMMLERCSCTYVGDLELGPW
jgi:hypothetical protein